MISIVVPACNEGRVIERCLEGLLRDAAPNEIEIVVVCNGCTDETAERARRFGSPVKVVETPIGSKIHALNLGDKEVTSFPRFYVDADIELTMAAVRDVAALLDDHSPTVVAAPRAVVEYRGRPWMVRSFYRVWTRMPYFRKDMTGSGVFAFSRRGRERFGEFPDVITDDEFDRRMAAPSERRASAHTTFTIHAPRTVEGLVKILSRSRAGRYELHERFPALQDVAETGAWSTFLTLVTTPSLWIHAPAYLAITLLTVRRARQKMRQKTNRFWDRDESSRQ